MNNSELQEILNTKYIEWTVFDKRTVYITGATGLIGFALVQTLLFVRSELNININIVIQVRDRAKAYDMFEEDVIYVVNDLCDNPQYDEEVHYIIHCANPTSSSFFVNNPVETVRTAVCGTLNILDFAKSKQVDGFLFLSTMEVYGKPEKGHKVTDDESGCFDSSKVRNCYPLSKLTCESLCVGYYSEYSVPTKVLRLTQTFGTGVNYYDGRVFAEFARCAIEKKDIVLKTTGETERSYLYITDAITAIFTVLLNGKLGENYTAANEDTYCSIYDMARMVANSNNINVVINEQDTTKYGYADKLYMDLDVSKLKELGWKPEIDLKSAYNRLIEYMKGNIMEP